MAYQNFIIYIIMLSGCIDFWLWRGLLHHIETHYPHIWHQAYSYDRLPGTAVRGDYIREMLKSGELANSDDPKILGYRKRRYWVMGIMIAAIALGLSRLLF